MLYRFRDSPAPTPTQSRGRSTDWYKSWFRFLRYSNEVVAHCASEANMSRRVKFVRVIGGWTDDLQIKGRAVMADSDAFLTKLTPRILSTTNIYIMISVSVTHNKPTRITHSFTLTTANISEIKISWIGVIVFASNSATSCAAQILAQWGRRCNCRRFSGISSLEC